MELKSINASGAVTFGSLLIVPYGIEILYNRNTHRASGAFNRTLWN